jgi:hypothetical protein
MNVTRNCSRRHYLLHLRCERVHTIVRPDARSELTVQSFTHDGEIYLSTPCLNSQSKTTRMDSRAKKTDTAIKHTTLLRSSGASIVLEFAL